MKRRYGWARWLTWWHRPAARPKGRDFGDYGTAFGLDLSLEEDRRRQLARGLPGDDARQPDTSLHPL